ncbi:hypothetical protein J3459_013665 [Metarhizium acridum]|nr:hypothetical protein J3459_013665 [Metarhizium acridum]
MVIPPALLNSRGGGLDIKADCKDGQGARGPNIDYGQWENAKGAKLERLSYTKKLQKLAEMVELGMTHIEDTSTLDGVEFFETLATNAMYTAREGAAELAELTQKCKETGQDIAKNLCKEELEYYIRDRREYAKFFTTAATKSLDIIRTSLKEQEDADKKAKIATQLRDWLARLQESLDIKVRELESIKKGDPITVTTGNAKFLAIEKRALETELKIMKKRLKKIINDATVLEAKANPGSTSESGNKNKSAIQRFKDWLGKTWARILPSNDDDEGEDGEGADNTRDDDFEEPPKHPQNKKPKPSTSNNGEGADNTADDDFEEPPKNPQNNKPKPSTPNNGEEADDTADDDFEEPPKHPQNKKLKPSTSDDKHGTDDTGDDNFEEPPKHTKPKTQARPSNQEGEGGHPGQAGGGDDDDNSSTGTTVKPKPNSKPKSKPKD